MAISYEPELLLARDQGLKLVSIGALVQRPLTSIIALPRQPRAQRRRPRRARRVGTAGIPYQAAELKTALHGRARRTRRASSEVNVGFNLVPAMLSGQGRRDARRLLELRGDAAAQLHKRPLTDPRRSRRRARRTTSWCSSCARTRRARAARTCARSCRRSRAASARCAPTRPRPPRSSSRPTPRSNRSCSWHRSSRRCRRRCPRKRASRSAGRSPSAWAAFGSWMFSHAPARARPQRRTAAVHERVPARPGDLSAVACASGLLTGGGDCPGLNAVIRAVVRRGLADPGHSVRRLSPRLGGRAARRRDRADAAEHGRHPAARRHDPRHLAHEPVRRRRRRHRARSARRSRRAASTR